MNNGMTRAASISPVGPTSKPTKEKPNDRPCQAVRSNPATSAGPAEAGRELCGVRRHRPFSSGSALRGRSSSLGSTHKTRSPPRCPSRPHGEVPAESGDVRCCGKTGHTADIGKPTRLTLTGHGGTAHSITSSARVSRMGGTARPSVAARRPLLGHSGNPARRRPSANLRRYSDLRKGPCVSPKVDTRRLGSIRCSRVQSRAASAGFPDMAAEAAPRRRYGAESGRSCNALLTQRDASSYRPAM